MRKINDLYSKQVINQSTGEKVASISDVVLSDDARRVIALVVGGGMWSNDEQVIRWDAVRSIGEYVIVEGASPFSAVAEDAEIGELRKQGHQITGAMIVDTHGERLGSVGDMFFEPSGQIIGYSIKQGMLGNSDDLFLPADQVQVVGKDAVIANAGDFMSLKNIDWSDDLPAVSTASHPDNSITRELPRPLAPVELDDIAPATPQSDMRELREQEIGASHEPATLHNSPLDDRGIN